MVAHNQSNSLAESGYCWLRAALGRPDVDLLCGRLQEIAGRCGDSERKMAGIRVALADCPEAARITGLSAISGILNPALNGAPRIVRAILFDKSPTARWFVGWHRDTMIPVKAHLPSTTLTAPSIKDGVPHVCATTNILSRMLAIRIHLDAMHETNGPLRVIPGTHRVRDSEIDNVSADERARAITLAAAPGDILLMRPLLLHSSQKPSGAGRRRVLQLEVTGPDDLPDGFEWHTA